MSTQRWISRMSIWAIGVLLATAVACKKETPTTPAPGGTGTKAAVTPGAAGPTGPAKTVQVPEPKAIAMPDVAVVVRVKRLDQVLPKVEALVKQVVPGMTMDAMKAQIGAQLNDPTLTGVDQSRSAMLVVFDPAGTPQPSAAAFLPVTSDKYKALFEGRGMSVYQKEGGKTMLLAEQESAAVAGRQAFDKLEPMLGEPMDSDINVYVNVELLMSRHGADIDRGLNEMVSNIEQMQGAMGQTTGSAQILGLELRAVLSAIKDMKDLGVDVTVAPDGVDLGTTFRAKPGTALAKVLDQPSVPNLSVLGYVPGTGAIVGVSVNDGGLIADFINSKIDEVFPAAGGQPAGGLNRDQLKALITRSMKLKKGTAFDIMNAGGTGGFAGIIVTEVTDPAAYLTELENVKATMEGTGIVSFYRNMGMDMKVDFKKNIRTYNGVPIHQMITDVNMPQMAEMPPMMAPIMKMFTHQEFEIAMVGNYAIQDMGSKKMDTVIDAVKAKKPFTTPALAAMRVFPKEGDTYLDIHPGRLANWVLEIIQPMIGPMLAGNPQGEAILAKFKGLQTLPISFSSADFQGKGRFNLKIPVDPIVKIKAIFEAPPAAPPRAL